MPEQLSLKQIQTGVIACPLCQLAVQIRGETMLMENLSENRIRFAKIQFICPNRHILTFSFESAFKDARAVYPPVLKTQPIDLAPLAIYLNVTVEEEDRKLDFDLPQEKPLWDRTLPR